MNSIAAESLGKCYTVKKSSMLIWALRDVSFTVRPGEALGIIGRNGAGKTTLLKVLGRITPPTAGRAILNGRAVSLLEMGIGFQPDLSARENIFLNAAIYGLNPREVKRHFDRIIAFAGLEKFVDGLPLRHFSSGMYLRLAFSVAVNMDPDILLADEVLAVGDLSFREKCMERMREIGKQGTSVLFVSHDMDAVKRLCGRCIRLDEGKIVDEGAPDRVIENYASAVQAAPATKAGRTEGPFSEYGEIVSVGLADAHGGGIGAAKTSADFFVELTFRMSKTNIHVRCGFDLQAGGVTVFRSMQPENFRVAAPGVYKAACRVPARLLADIVYGVNAFVAVVHDDKGRTIHRKIVAYEALNFQVYETDDAFRDELDQRRSPRVIAPRLAWGNVQPALTGEAALRHADD